ncbi:MAG: hypothetical protein RMY29_021420 [Nostoc sp. CreGUA01]|nr:hypothetical protein [Nostoc sp. CreGUA01]
MTHIPSKASEKAGKSSQSFLDSQGLGNIQVLNTTASCSIRQSHRIQLENSLLVKVFFAAIAIQ